MDQHPKLLNKLSYSYKQKKKLPGPLEKINEQAQEDFIAKFNNLSEENQKIRAEKINYLEKALILETRSGERLRLKYEIKALKNKPSFINLPKVNKDQ